MKDDKIIITCSVPSIDREFSIEDLYKFVKADIFNRFLNLTSQDSVFTCALQVHSPSYEPETDENKEEIDKKLSAVIEEKRKFFQKFGIEFDGLYSTHISKTKHFIELFFRRLRGLDHVYRTETEQNYCETCNLFASPFESQKICSHCRGIFNGTSACPFCGVAIEESEPGDACARCGSEYVKKTRVHYFYKISEYKHRLKEWLKNPKSFPGEVKSYIEEKLEEELPDAEISRDQNYLGFAIPGEESLYFNEYFDIAASFPAVTEEYLDKIEGKNAKHWSNSKSHIFHFMSSKDWYMYSLIWPSILMGTRFALPERIVAHGDVIVGSSSDDKPDISAEVFEKFFNPETLRYFFAANSSSSIKPAEFNEKEFYALIKEDLTDRLNWLFDNLINFIHQNLKGRIANLPEKQTKLEKYISQKAQVLFTHYLSLNFNSAIEEIRKVADLGIKYLKEADLPRLVKKDEQEARKIATAVLNFCKALVVFIKPILPHTAMEAEKILRIKPLTWNDHKFNLENHKIGPFFRLINSPNNDKFSKMIYASEKKNNNVNISDVKEMLAKPSISMEDFLKIDLRVAEITGAEKVTDAAKHLRITLDAGNGKKVVLAGIGLSYQPETLIGKKVLFVANLKAEKLKHGMSEGMILAAGINDETITLAEFPGEIPPGVIVH